MWCCEARHHIIPEMGLRTPSADAADLIIDGYVNHDDAHDNDDHGNDGGE